MAAFNWMARIRKWSEAAKGEEEDGENKKLPDFNEIILNV